MWLKLLIGGAAALLGYAAYQSKAKTDAANAQAKGVMSPAYNPVGQLWSEDQPSSSVHTPANPVIGWLHQMPKVVNDMPYGPSGSLAQTCGAPSGVSGRCASRSDIILSPTFWAADKVPTNPALQVDTNSIDANPYLDYNSGRISPVGAQPPVPVNHA